MFGRHVPLAEHVVKLFHVLDSFVYFSTRSTTVETLVRGVTSAFALLERQSFPASHDHHVFLTHNECMTCVLLHDLNHAQENPVLA